PDLPSLPTRRSSDLSADSRNWGVWTDAPATGDIVDYDGFTDPDIEDCAFYYEQFEDTLTWVYSRSFSEGEGGSGSRIAEGIGFRSEEHTSELQSREN